MSIKSSKLFMTYVCNTDDDYNCVICHSNINCNSVYSNVFTNEVEKTHCGHTFHTACLQNWLSKNRKCPLCAKKI